MATERYRSGGGYAQGAPATSAFGQALKRALPRLYGHPAQVVQPDKPYPGLIGVVIAPPGLSTMVVNRKGYTGILPLKVQPLVVKPNPWTER